jgi:hypothetical protein
MNRNFKLVKKAYDLHRLRKRVPEIDDGQAPRLTSGHEVCHALSIVLHKLGM